MSSDRDPKYPKKVYRAVKSLTYLISSPFKIQSMNFYKEYLTGPQCIYLPLCIDEIPRNRVSLNTNQITVMGRLSKEKPMMIC